MSPARWSFAHGPTFSSAVATLVPSLPSSLARRIQDETARASEVDDGSDG